MKITAKQLMNPGAIDYDDKRHKQMQRYKEEVNRAKFLDKEQKSRWEMLGYFLTTDQLEEAEDLIINENLRRLKTKQSLEKLKPKPRQ